MATIQKITNCFAPIPKENRAPAAEPLPVIPTHTNIVLVPVPKQIGDDIENIVLEYKAVEKETYDITEYIESFADDVGIQNIIKKLALSGDKSLLNQTGRQPLNENGGLEPIQDYSDVPHSKTEAFNAVVNGVNAFDNLPDDMKGKMSLTQFVQYFGEDEFNAYIKSVIDKQKGDSENV